jgi:hypothetical protein
MSWRRGELWLETDIFWPGDGAGAPAMAGVVPLPSFARGSPPGLLASRRRRDEWKRRRHDKRAKASAVALSPAVMLVLAGLRSGTANEASFLAEDPPSLTFRFDAGTAGARDSVPAANRNSAHRKLVRANALPEIEWHHARSIGLPYGGSLIDGTQLPVEGPNWVTWNPITDSRPNVPARLYGNERTIRAIVLVTKAYREAHPKASRVVIGDISRTHGGTMDDHLSHQNGLDVDVYFPRLDRELRAPRTTGEIDHRLAQDLLNRFVAAGAQMIFVGYSTRLHGPASVVMHWPGHDYHMHVRFPPPGA